VEVTVQGCVSEITKFPVVAPFGTVTTSWVAELETVVAVIPLKTAEAPDKLPAVAVIVTWLPTIPAAGEIAEMLGGVQEVVVVVPFNITLLTLVFVSIPPVPPVFLEP